MPFYIGENKIVDQYVGDKLVAAAYKGETKYFDAYSEITGTLPIIFKSRAAVALKNYLLHGTSEGAGVETSGTEPAGYKLPLTITSGAQSQDYPLYIGSTKLGAEEYLDYGEQKVYKRTENLWDESYLLINYGSTTTPRYKVLYVGDGDFTVSTNLPKHTHYPSLALLSGSKNTGGMNDGDFSSATWAEHPHTVASENGYITIVYRKFPYDPRNYWCMLNAGSTAETYAPYLNPTDPPVPLPEILTYQGENTLSSTETLGEATIKGRINELPTQQPDN